jgi:hypothetical protein
LKNLTEAGSISKLELPTCRAVPLLRLLFRTEVGCPPFPVGLGWQLKISREVEQLEQLWQFDGININFESKIII